MNKHFRRLQEADYVPVSLNDKEMMDPSSLSLKSVAKRNKDDADRAEAEAAKKVVRTENATKYNKVEEILDQELDKGKQASDILDMVFDTGIVPGSGKADTKAGEIIRAMMRVIYRYYNDGDKFFEGYGLETAAPSIAYLIDTIDEVATYVGNMMERLYDYDSDAKYNDAIETLADICLHHIQAHFEELMDPNEEDSRDWSGPSLEEIEENQPKYEYDVWGSDDIVVLVENGVLNAWDLKEYVEDMMHWEQAFKGAEIDRPWSHTSTELNITNLTKDGYDLIRDWFHNREEQFWEDLVEQYRDELDAIYNEDSEDGDEDEDIDENVKNKGIKLVPDQLVGDIHIDASGQSVGIAGGTGGSVSNTGHTSNSTNNSKKLTEKSRNPQIRKIEIELAKELGKNNLKLNPEEMDLETAAEYIYMSGANAEYTVQDWIKDTKENYPECFLNESVKEAYKSNYELARPNEAAIQRLLDNGLVSAETLLSEILGYVPDDALEGFLEANGYDDELDEDIKLVFQPELKKG